MDQSAITVRYAKAFFSLAKEKNLLEDFKVDIELVSSVCSNSVDFILLLESPIVKTSKKITLIKSIFEGKLHAYTLKFMLLIAKNNREVNIPGICRNFLALTRKEQNIKSAIITTATQINKDIIEKVEKLLSKELNAKIELSTKTNSELLGGMILRVDDTQYDASVSTQLKKIKQSLLNTEIR